MCACVLAPLFYVRRPFDLLIHNQIPDSWSGDRNESGQRCDCKLAELTADDVRQIAGAGDQQLQRLAYSSRRDTLELGAEDNDGLSQQACTALAEE